MDDDHCILGGQKRGKDHSKAAFLLNPITSQYLTYTLYPVYGAVVLVLLPGNAVMKSLCSMGLR